MKISIFAVVAVIAAVATTTEAVSCQSQGDSRGKGYCISGGKSCPKGRKSVFWDSGCHKKSWWKPWDKTDKCCIPN
ncbi:hypothetical protein BGZ76_003706 [Entomortierella beljakovae]|nr:hypothetical protein BGZ76_003706 [Entomortierella beljakovae]